ncbi:MAG TPA: hypothetical protein VF461_11775 [Gemmatimonadaceae bacterium]
MSSARHPERVFIDPSDLEAVAAALCSRFGDPTAEAYRRSTLHDVLKSVRSLAASLEGFARAGGTHFRGVHVTADMHAEVEHLSRYLASWMDAVRAAGNAYRECHQERELSSLRTPRLTEVVLPKSALGDTRPVLGMPS